MYAYSIEVYRGRSWPKEWGTKIQVCTSNFFGIVPSLKHPKRCYSKRERLPSNYNSGGTFEHSKDCSQCRWGHKTHYWPPFIWVNYNISASSKFQKWWLNKTEMGTNPSRVTWPSATQIGPCQRDEWHKKEANRTPKRSSPCESSHHLICSNWKFCTAKTWVKLPVFWKKNGCVFPQNPSLWKLFWKKGMADFILVRFLEFLHSSFRWPGGIWKWVYRTRVSEGSMKIWKNLVKTECCSHEESTSLNFRQFFGDFRRHSLKYQDGLPKRSSSKVMRFAFHKLPQKSNELRPLQRPYFLSRFSSPALQGPIILGPSSRFWFTFGCIYHNCILHGKSRLVKDCHAPRLAPFVPADTSWPQFWRGWLLGTLRDHGLRDNPYIFGS